MVEVKVAEAGETVPSVKSLDDNPIETSAVGCEFNFIEKVAVPRASVVVNPLVGLTVIPATSSSILVTVTSDGSIPA